MLAFCPLCYQKAQNSIVKVFEKFDELRFNSLMVNDAVIVQGSRPSGQARR